MPLGISVALQLGFSRCGFVVVMSPPDSSSPASRSHRASIGLQLGISRCGFVVVMSPPDSSSPASRSHRVSIALASPGQICYVVTVVVLLSHRISIPLASPGQICYVVTVVCCCLTGCHPGALFMMAG